MYGILGGIPYILIFIQCYIDNKKEVNETLQKVYRVIFLIYILISLLNTSENVLIYYTFIVYIPLTLKFIFMQNEMKIYSLM